MKNILLTFDIEKLGLSSYGLKLEENKRYEIAIIGFKKILLILDKNKIKATFFITADFAVRYKKFIKEISKKHEIASHGLEHKDNYILLDEKTAIERIKKSKQIIEQIIGKKMLGFRAPRFQLKNYSILEKADLTYDSSLNPTYIPGNYNNFFKKRKVFKVGNIIEIPSSVTPIFRLPLFWFAFRNLGLWYAKLCTLKCLIDNDYALTIFHPWEFYDLREFNLPKNIKRNTGKKLEQMFTEYVKWCLKKRYRFLTISEYIKSKNLLK